MYQLYYYPGNANLAPHMLLEEIGVKYELVFVDQPNNAQKSAEYLKLNPHGRIPTLVDGDLVLYETAAICLHLCDGHPDAQLAPPLGTPLRAQFYKQLIYLTNTLQSELIVYFYPQRWAADETAAAKVKAFAERRIADMLDLIEAELAAHAGPWLLGDVYSAADAYLFMLTRWTRMMGKPASSRPFIRQFQERMSLRPAIQRTFAAEGIAPPYFLAS